MLHLLYLMTANTGLVCLVKIFSNVNFKKSRAINKFLVIIFFFQSIRFLTYGVAPFFEQTNKLDIWPIDMLNAMIVPCYYLYFVDLIEAGKKRAFKFLHLSWVPICMVMVLLILRITDISKNLEDRAQIIFLTAMLIFSGYAVLIFRLLNTHVWKRRSELKTVDRQNKVIRHWTTFVYVGFMVLLLKTLVGFAFDGFVYKGHSEALYLWLAALFWTALFIKVIITPEILYGLNFLNKLDEKVNPHNLMMSEIWSAGKTVIPVENERDKKLQEKIKPNLFQYLHQIENKLLFSDVLKNPDFGLEDLAAETGIPASHLTFIFRYHSRESFNDCKKILRVKEAVRILEEENLQLLTFEAIAKNVGFNSYTTFFNSFKSIVGKTPLEVKGNRNMLGDQ